MSKISTMIKAMRDAGLSQSEISRRTHIPQPRLSRWEAGEVPNSASDALELQALHDELVGKPGAPEPQAEQGVSHG